MTCDLSILVTLREAADALGLTMSAATQRATTRGLGRVFGGNGRGVRILTPEDVKELAKEVPAHRPPSVRQERAVITEAAYQRAERAVEALRERGNE